MSLIFDRFPSRKKAENFAAFIEGKYGLKGQIFEDECKIYTQQLPPRSCPDNNPKKEPLPEWTIPSLAPK